MRHIWRRRLEQCAKDLCDPRRAGERIAEIAFRWGFGDASHFSRAFRQQFGCAPGASGGGIEPIRLCKDL